MNIHRNAKIHTTKPSFPVPCTCGLNDWTAERARSREKNTPSYSALLSSSLVIDRSSQRLSQARVTLSDSSPPVRTRLVLRVTGFRTLCSFLPGRESRDPQESARVRNAPRNVPEPDCDGASKMPSEYLLVEDEVLFSLHNYAAAPKLSVETKIGA